MEETESGSGACDHTQPSDVAAWGENYLRSRGLAEPAWEGCRFGYGGDGGTGPFKSVYTEVARKGGAWIAVKLERRQDDLPPDKRGFQVVLLPEALRKPGT